MGSTQYVYTTRQIFQKYLASNPKSVFDLDKEEGRVKRFRTLLDAATCSQLITVGAGGGISEVHLKDGSIFVLPSDLFTLLELTAPQKSPGLNVQRGSMRAFARMGQFLMDEVKPGDDVYNQDLIARYFKREVGYGDSELSSVRQVLWALGTLPAWLDKAMSGGGSVSSGSSVNSDASSTFTFAAAGGVFRVFDLVATMGRDKFKTACFPQKDVLDLSYVPGGASVSPLTSIDDLVQVIEEVLTPAERAAVKRLNLEGNSVRKVPSGAFACFENLTHLILDSNPVQEYDKGCFMGLRDLRLLSLVGACDGALLDDAIVAELTHLKSLYLRQCGLSWCPDFSALTELETLDVSQNSLTEMPDLSALKGLRTFNAMNNKLTAIVIAHLPCGSDGKLTLSKLQLNNNAIATIPTAFYGLLPDAGTVSILLHNNPAWATAGGAGVAGLQANGFQKLPDADRSRGTAIAQEVEAAICDDLSDKLCAYLANNGHACAEEVVREEMRCKRKRSGINTAGMDSAATVHKYRWWIIAGAVLVTGGIGGGVAVFVKSATLAVGKKVAIGAVAGALAGGVSATIGCKLYAGGGHMYINTGGPQVRMTTSLKAFYVGVCRMVAFISLLKQYLTALDVALEWLVHYEDYEARDEADRVDEVLSHFEDNLILGTKKVLARVNDATTIALLHELITESPLKNVLKHVPSDLFGTTSDIALASIDDGAASYPWLGLEKLSLVRRALVNFASAAKSVRAALVNRYLGSAAYTHVCRLISNAKELKKALDAVTDEICAPLAAAMEAAGASTEKMYKEVVNFKVLAGRIKELFKKLKNDKAHMDRITS